MISTMTRRTLIALPLATLAPARPNNAAVIALLISMKGDLDRRIERLERDLAGKFAEASVKCDALRFPASQSRRGSARTKT
jgi:hypothetical protein